MTTAATAATSALQRFPRAALASAPALATPNADQRRRVARLLLIRTLVVTIVLGLSLWLLGNDAVPPRSAVWVQSAVIVATYLTTIVFGVLLLRGLDPGRVASPMLANDVALTSVLVFITGGAQSPYTFLYALSIVAAGALAYRRGAVFVTLASLAAMLAVSLLCWRNTFDAPRLAELRPWTQSATAFARTLGINLAATTGVGALAFLFGDQLQRGAETLATTRQAAAELLSLHQDIVRSLSTGLITTSLRGTIVTANEAAAELLGVSLAELEERPLDGIMPGLGSLPGRDTALRRGELEVPTADGRRTLGVMVSPLRDARDDEIGRIVHFQDLTELRRLEQHARRSERLATVGQLAAGIAHEIRNPMAAISGSVELLRQSPQTSEDDRALMTIVHREIRRLDHLIGDLLDYANPRANQPVDADVGSLVSETVQVARGDSSFHDVEFTAEVAPSLVLHVDPAKLRQIVWNLVRNAAEAASLGGKHVRVVVRRAGEGGAEIAVSDDGPGIPEAQVGHIFDPFMTTKSNGTGLGLATCHAIVAEHGGRIDVDTTLGRGTTMTVQLPGTTPSASRTLDD